MRPLADRLWSRVVQTDAGCWEFTGTISGGYGRIYGPGGSTLLTHRVAYELLIGPIPAGLQIDHLCRNRACCRPSHLEPVTPRENVMRSENFAAVNASKSACSNGHEFTPENTRLVTRRTVRPGGAEWAGVRRSCRECDRQRQDAV